jgi:S-adenosylmethionine:tRNA ribosyltransferase-isomerase
MGKPMLAQPTTRFRRPDDLQAAEPPEARGLERDGVRLLTATPEGIRHGHFRDLGAALRPGDLLVVNTSATRPAAIDGTARGLGPVVVHVSGRHPGGPATDEGEAGDWVVELRTAPTASTPIRHARAGTRVRLAGGVTLTLIGPAGEPAAGEPAVGGGSGGGVPCAAITTSSRAIATYGSRSDVAIPRTTAGRTVPGSATAASRRLTSLSAWYGSLRCP